MKKVLVAYATHHGSTEGIARTIADAIREGGADVTLEAITPATDPSGFDALVIGSAINGGRWLPQATNFLKGRAGELQGKPVAFFLACMTMSKDTPEHRSKVLAYLKSEQLLLPPVSVGLFSGSIDLKKVPLVMRVLWRLLGGEVGDCRRLDEVRAWATGVTPRLTSA
jgi:menaquinone-dependent protoporphyrinogen oxidase